MLIIKNKLSDCRVTRGSNHIATNSRQSEGHNKIDCEELRSNVLSGCKKSIMTF